MFTLDTRLAADTVFILDLPLCQMRLMDDSRYPWVVLVPRRDGIREIHELAFADRAALLDESCRVAEHMVALFAPTKMNVAALGNVVPQLHVHHVARFTHDATWPAPVWGRGERVPYDAAAREVLCERIRRALTP